MYQASTIAAPPVATAAAGVLPGYSGFGGGLVMAPLYDAITAVRAGVNPRTLCFSALDAFCVSKALSKG